MQIGRIITRHAILEWQLRQVCYRILDVQQKEGRVAVREPRIINYMTMIEDLLTIKEIDVSIDTKKFKKSLNEFAFYRNALCHGVWIRDPKTKLPVLQFTSWELGFPPGMPPGRKAKIDPKSAKIRLKFLRNLAKAIDLSIQQVRQLEKEINAKLKALQKKRLSQQK